MSSLGFIGLGSMGGPMARNLISADHDVTAFDLDDDALEAIAEAGGTAATSAGEAASGAEVVFLSLPGPNNVEAVVDAIEAEVRSRGYEPDNPWYFPTIGEYASKLETHGFEVRYATLFDRPTTLDGGERGLAEWIEMFGGRILSSVPDEERLPVISAVEDRVRDELFEDGIWIMGYRRLRVVAARADGE